ncbi:hypothetical protein HDU67_003135 [Dinochytrium kinnereticum]|nr:hypothetical protein HDU67_003135 [Dinochytrium kinnereticum]
MDLSHLTEELDEFEDFVEKYSSEMKDIMEGKIPESLKEQEASELLIKKSDAKQLLGHPSPLPITLPNLQKASSDSSITVVPKAAEPQTESNLKTMTQEVSIDDESKNKSGDKAKNYLDYSRFDNLKDEDEETPVEQPKPEPKDEKPSHDAAKKKKYPLSTKPKPLSNSEILRILSEEHKAAGNEAFRKGDHRAAAEAYTQSINICLKPTKEMIIEFKARTAPRESDPFAFLDKIGPNPDAILPDAAVYNNRALVRTKMDLWSEAREDCIAAIDVLKRLEKEGGAVKHFETYVKSMSRKISIERQLDLLAEAESSLNDLLSKFESKQSLRSQLITANETLKTLETVEKERYDAEEETKISLTSYRRELIHMKNSLQSFSTAISKERGKDDRLDGGRSTAGLISASIASTISDKQSAVSFRLCNGFESLLDGDVLHFSTLPFILPIINSAVTNGWNPRYSTSPNTRQVTCRIYPILNAFLDTPRNSKKQVLKMIVRLLAVCSLDTYFLDYITKSPFIQSPDGAKIWKAIMIEIVSELQEVGSRNHRDRITIAVYSLTFTLSLMRHSPIGPKAAFNDWGISVPSFLRLAESFIGYTYDLEVFGLNLGCETLGQLACITLDEILHARKYSKVSVSPEEILTTGCEVVGVVRNNIKGKASRQNSSRYRDQIHGLKASLYYILYRLLPDLNISEVEAQMDCRVIKLLFQGLLDIRNVDPEIEMSTEHLKWLLLSCSCLLKEHRSEVFDELVDKWGDIFLPEIFNLIFEKFVYEKESNEINVMCRAATKLLVVWMEDDDSHADWWVRGESGFSSFAQVLNEALRRRKGGSSEVTTVIGGNMALCIGACAKNLDNAKSLFELGVLDSLVAMLRLERAGGDKDLQKNLSIACARISQYGPARDRLRTLKGFELLYSLGSKIVG